METQPAQPKDKSQFRKYVYAIVLIILFIIAVRFLDNFINFIIIVYFPGLINYTNYVSATANTVLGIFGAYVVYRVLLSIIARYKLKGRNTDTIEIVLLFLRILFYAAVITIALLAFGPLLGISPSSALAGGAIGGVIVGLAIQTVASSILSGILVSSSRTISAGDVLIIHSSLWGGDIICKVITVNILFTEVANINGNRMKIPNTTLLNAATFTKLRSGDEYTYTFQISTTADIPVEKFYKKVNSDLKEAFSKLKKKAPEVYLISKTAGANNFIVTMTFDTFAEINYLVDATNRTFDSVYWSLKK